jgi:hypothetical protein
MTMGLALRVLLPLELPPQPLGMTPITMAISVIIVTAINDRMPVFVTIFIPPILGRSLSSTSQLPRLIPPLNCKSGISFFGFHYLFHTPIYWCENLFQLK